jgi:hypothetical protein
VISDETGSGALVFGTAPTITGGAHTAMTSLGVRSTGTGAFDLTIANAENLTAGRTLTVTVGNAARTLTLNGDAFFSANFFTTPANNITLTTTGITNVTLPVTGTLATLAGSETLTNKTISGASNALSSIALSSHAAQAAYTFVGNNSGSSAAPTAVDIAALTSKASPAASDYIMLSDQAASGAWKRATIASLASAGSVASIAGNTGAFTLGNGLTNATNDIQFSGIFTSSSATALAIGRLGSTTPAFQVDASTGSSITGLKVKAAASGGGVAVSATGETNVALKVDANGAGTLTLNGTATGNVTTPRVTTFTNGTDASPGAGAVIVTGGLATGGKIYAGTTIQAAGAIAAGARMSATGIDLAGDVTISAGAANCVVNINATSGNPLINFLRGGGGVANMVDDGAEIIVGSNANNSAGAYMPHGTSSWLGISDRRIKKDVETLSILHRLGTFRAISYTNTMTGRREVGAVAQEQATCFPELVKFGTDDEDGEPIESLLDQRAYGLSYERYGVLAMQAVKELHAIVLQQAARIDELERRAKVNAPS